MLHLLDRGHGLPGDDLDAAPFHFAAQMFPHVVVETAQDVLAAIDQAHLGAEPGKYVGELDRDVTAALDQNALGQFWKVKSLVRGNDVLKPGNLRTVIGCRAGRD